MSTNEKMGATTEGFRVERDVSGRFWVAFGLVGDSEMAILSRPKKADAEREGREQHAILVAAKKVALRYLGREVVREDAVFSIRAIPGVKDASEARFLLSLFCGEAA